MAFLTSEQLAACDFGRVGRNVQISDKASFYNPRGITIGDFSRIDDFCVLSAGEGGISIGGHVHIAAFCSLIGAARIELADFSGLSTRVSIFSSNDDYSGRSMTNPTVPSWYRVVTNDPVKICKHVIVGSGSVILPGVTLKEGAAVGALTLVKDDCDEFRTYSGVPARRVGKRLRNLLVVEESLYGLLPDPRPTY